MTNNNRLYVRAVPVAVVLAAMNFGCGSSPTGPPPVPIIVSLPSATATVEVGATAQFTASVTNDSANKGVNWTVSCSTAPCGGVSPAATASASPTTFTPPVQAGALTVTLTATSASDPAKSANVVITVPAVTVNLSSISATVALGAQAPFSATVANDGANAGVNWTVSCPQAPCGSVSPGSTASGVATTYTAPAAPAAGSLMVTLTATSATDSAVSTPAAITVPGIMVSISPGPDSTTLPSGGVQQFTATVTGDPSNGPVAWGAYLSYETGCPLKCVYHIAPCNGHCGSFAPTNTTSGVATTYTAPADPSTYRLTITATSTTNSGANVGETVIVLPISIAVSPSPASVVLKAAQQFTATVTNDATSSGVTWSVMQNGAACSPACGTVSPAKTASGGSTTYTAPAASPSLPVVAVTATSVEDPTKSGSGTETFTTSTGVLPCDAGSGSESLLKGQYAFLLASFAPQSFDNLGILGSITADGSGRITAGEEDNALIGGDSKVTPVITTLSSYAVGPDHRGCLLLVYANMQFYPGGGST